MVEIEERRLSALQENVASFGESLVHQTDGVCHHRHDARR